MVAEAVPIALADSQDQVGVRRLAGLPPDPIAQRLPRPAIRVPSLPMRARAEMRIARRLQMPIERHLEIAGQLMPEEARRGRMPRV